MWQALPSDHQGPLSGQWQTVTQFPSLVAMAAPANFQTPATLVHKEADGNQDPRLVATGALTRFRTPTTLVWKVADDIPDPNTGGDGCSGSLPDTS